MTWRITERILRLNFSDGATVRAGQVIAVLAQGQETAALDDAAARQREAEQQLSRPRELRERGFATNANPDAQIAADRKRVLEGKSVSVSVDLVGRRIIKK